MATLRAVRDGFTVDLPVGVTVVGRDPAPQPDARAARLPPSLAGASISRSHAMFVVLPGGRTTVRDVSSGVGALHGLFVDGVMLARGADRGLRPLDVVTLGPPAHEGSVALQLHAEPPPHAPDTNEQLEAPQAGDLVAVLRQHVRCSICLDTVAHAVAPPCGHSACALCLLNWTQRSAGDDGAPRRRGRCPSCVGTVAPLMRRHDLDSIVADCGLVEPTERLAHARRAAVGRASLAGAPEGDEAMPADVVSARIDSLQVMLDEWEKRTSQALHAVLAQLGSLRGAVAALAAAPQEPGRKRKQPDRYGFE